MIAFLFNVFLIIFVTCESINNNFFWLHSRLQEQINGLIVKGNLDRDCIIASSDDLVVFFGDNNRAWC